MNILSMLKSKRVYRTVLKSTGKVVTPTGHYASREGVHYTEVMVPLPSVGRRGDACRLLMVRNTKLESVLQTAL